MFFELRRFIETNPSVEKQLETLKNESNYLFKIVFERLDQLQIQIPLLPPGRRKIGL